MTTTETTEDLRQVILLLADISGYTQFMMEHEKELRHSQTIVRELLETLMKEVDVPLQISRIEGDALFMYAVKSGDEEIWERRGKALLDRLMTLFRAFAERIQEIGAYSICRCDACKRVGDLKLKVIIHSGEALLDHVGEHPTLSGVDVITIHRLGKNSVEEDEYVLMTESAYRDLGAPEGVAIRESEEVYDTGTFKTFVYVPELDVELDESQIRAAFSNDNAAVQILRDEISREYEHVVHDPDRGYHFNLGRAGLAMNEYDPGLYEGLPDDALRSFAGTGNPFAIDDIREGEYVVDVGSGAGVDAMIAARLVGDAGHVIGVDMTDEMVATSDEARKQVGLNNLEFRKGFAESLPVPDDWADVVISNGVVNLSPSKELVFAEMFRVLRPGGRLQIADITVEKPVDERAMRNIDLWTN